MSVGDTRVDEPEQPHLLFATASRQRAAAMLHRLFERAAADATLDAEFAGTCFQMGITSLGVRFATRAAAALAAPERAEAEAVLKIARERSDGVGSDDLANLAQAHRRMGALQETAHLLVRAAEKARLEEAFMRAAEFARQAWELDPEASGVHRAWGLALLARGDAAGARGHLERWHAQEPDCLEAAFWVREATGFAARAERAAPASFLPAAVRAYPEKKRHVMILDGAITLPPGLLSSLARWGVEVCSTRVDGGGRSNAEPVGPVDLALVALPPNAALAREQLEWLRCLPALTHVPLLAFARLPSVAFDRVLLARLGVVGLVDRRAKRDEIAFRVARALGLEGSADATRVRVPVDFEVVLSMRDDELVTARAENLSRGGLRLRVPMALDLNEQLTLRFQLAAELVELEGRVIHCQPAPEDNGSYAVGVFFFSITTEHSKLLAAEIDRLLAATSPR